MILSDYYADELKKQIQISETQIELHKKKIDSRVELKNICYDLMKNANDQNTLNRVVNLMTDAFKNDDGDLPSLCQGCVGEETFLKVLPTVCKACENEEYVTFASIGFLFNAVFNYYWVKQPKDKEQLREIMGISPDGKRSRRILNIISYLSDNNSLSTEEKKKKWYYAHITNLSYVFEEYPDILFSTKYRHTIKDYIKMLGEAKVEHEFYKPIEKWLGELFTKIDPKAINQDTLDAAFSYGLSLENLLLNNPNLATEDNFIKSFTLAQSLGRDTSFVNQFIKINPELKKYEPFFGIKNMKIDTCRVLMQPNLILDDEDISYAKLAYLELFAYKEGTDKFYDMDAFERITLGSNLPYAAKEIIYNEFCELRETIIAENTPAKPKKKSDGKDDLG